MLVNYTPNSYKLLKLIQVPLERVTFNKLNLTLSINILSLSIPIFHPAQLLHILLSTVDRVRYSYTLVRRTVWIIIHCFMEAGKSISS